MYTIEAGSMDAFVDAWQRGVVPLRRTFGFEVDGAWIDREENRFVWLLSSDDRDGFEAHDAAYYASPERAALDPDPAGLIVASEHRFIEPVPLD
jgi:hypothetical protein